MRQTFARTRGRHELMAPKINAKSIFVDIRKRPKVFFATFSRARERERHCNSAVPLDRFVLYSFDFSIFPVQRVGKYIYTHILYIHIYIKNPSLPGLSLLFLLLFTLAFFPSNSSRTTRREGWYSIAQDLPENRSSTVLFLSRSYTRRARGMSSAPGAINIPSALRCCSPRTRALLCVCVRVCMCIDIYVCLLASLFSCTA